MSVPAYTIQHDRTIWGDPENFRPERWLEEKDLGRYLLTFGKGPRQCVSNILRNDHILADGQLLPPTQLGRK